MQLKTIQIFFVGKYVPLKVIIGITLLLICMIEQTSCCMRELFVKYCLADICVGIGS